MACKKDSSLQYYFVEFQQMNDRNSLYQYQKPAPPFIKILKKHKRPKIDVGKIINLSPQPASKNLSQSRTQEGLDEMISHYKSNFLYKKMLNSPMNHLEQQSSPLRQRKSKTSEMIKARGFSNKKDDLFVRYEDIEAPSLKLKLNKLNTISYQDSQAISRNCLAKFFTSRTNQSEQKPGSIKLIKIENRKLKLEEKQISPVYKSLEFIGSPRKVKKPKIKFFKKASKDEKNLSAWAINTGKSFGIP